MAGNILYIPYTVIMIIALIVCVLIIGIKKGTGSTKKFLTFTIPIIALFQLYFWNLEFNNYISSYLLSSNVYECESYMEEQINISIPLPQRTVIHGKSDSCSPFYSTYVDDKEFYSFYEKELKILQNNGEIESYSFIEQDEIQRSIKKGFLLELLSGSKIGIFISGNKGFDKWSISIDYNPKNRVLNPTNG
jgi:energy-coupling factor transporter transmembrane protein EcfT